MRVEQLRAGTLYLHTLSDGTVRCWGGNSFRRARQWDDKLLKRSGIGYRTERRERDCRRGNSYLRATFRRDSEMLGHERLGRPWRWDQH